MIAGESRVETKVVAVTLPGPDGTAATGKRLTGSFRWRVMSMRDRARIAGVVTELADGRAIADPELRTFVWMMAALSVQIERDPQTGAAICPEWFPLDFDKHDDPTLLSLVYKEYASWQDSFRAALAGNAAGTTGAAPTAGT